MQPLLEECQQKRELLHHVYALHACSSAGVAEAYERYMNASAEQNSAWLSAWALPGLSRFRAMEKSHRETLVTDAMEAVLEDTLRLNKSLNTQLVDLKRQLRQSLEAEAKRRP